jgi:RNA polymerase sigma factor (sigma-70 family)
MPLEYVVATGPVESVADLYSEHHGWLQSWLRKKLSCSETAADLAQDTFVRLLTRPQPSILYEPRAYLTTVAKGLLSNWYRRQTLEQAYLDALASIPEALAPAPELKLEILETLHLLDCALSSLSDKARTAFLLAQLDELKYEEIAQQLGVSLASVKHYMQQGYRICLSLSELLE